MKYHKYTKLNSTIKSATFELVPVGKTRDFLELHQGRFREKSKSGTGERSVRHIYCGILKKL